MTTTRKQALKVYNIATWIYPFDSCYADKEDTIKEIMKLSLEDNIEQIKNAIKEVYDTDDLLRDTILMRKYLNLVKELGIERYKNEV